MKGFFREEEIKSAVKTDNYAKKQSSCGACKLWRGCESPRMSVTGDGEKEIFILAEAPGETEDLKGRQLIGKAGQLLRAELRKNGIDLDKDCWKMNALSCRPPDNRTPTPIEIEYCRPKVFAAFEKYKPKAIVLLGSSAIISFLSHRWKKKLDGISKWRGWAIPDRDLKAFVFPLFHPSYVLRMENSAAPVIFSNDIRNMVGLYNKPFPEFPNEDECVETLLTKEEVTAYLKEVLRYKPKLLSFDYETTGLKPQAKGHKIAYLGMCWQKDRAASWPWNLTDISLYKKIMQDPEIGKTAANIRMEDTWTAVRTNIVIQGWKWCTMQNTHVQDNRKGITGLKFQVYRRFGVVDYDSSMEQYIESDKNTYGANGFNRIFEAPVKMACLYCGKDSLYNYWLAIDQMTEMGVL